MKYPKMYSQNEMRAKIEDLSGGLNVSKAANLINLNEQSEIKNMWFQNGCLKKRPSLKKIAELSGLMATEIELSGKRFLMKFDPNDNNTLGSLKSALVDSDGTVSYIEDLFFSEHRPDTLTEPSFVYTCFPFCSKDKIYVAVGYNHTDNTFGHGEIYSLKDNAFVKINDSEIYAPLILVNGKGNKFYTLPTDENYTFSPAVNYEGINLFTHRVRAQFTTDGASFIFKFPLARKYSTPVKVKLTGCFNSSDEIKEIEFTINSDGDLIDVPYNTNIQCFISNYNSIYFRSHTQTTATDKPPAASTISSNLEIEYYIDESPNEASLYEMNFSCYFGGSGGLNKGNRLFTAGGEKQTNLLRWSDLDNPLYFPENNFAMISNGKILSLKRQNNMLVIFSDKEIHYTTYIGGEISTNDIVSGNVIDVTTASGIFPITQLHGELGLYNRRTVALLQGKLIFLGNDKRLYRIDGKSQITKVSSKVGLYLKELPLDDAIANVFKNYFMLITKNGTLLFNNEYSNFYVWDINGNAIDFFGDDNSPIIIKDDGTYDFSGDEEFDFYFSTPAIEFNYPEKSKKILKIYVYGDDGIIECIADDKSKDIVKAIQRGKAISANIHGAKNLKLNIKNCDNVNGFTITYMIHQK